MRILLSGGNPHIPHLFPCSVEQLVHRIHPRMMRSDRIPRIHRNPFRLSEIFIQHHIVHEHRQIIVQMGLLMIPHVRKPHELINVLQNEIVPFIFLPITVMEIFPRKPQIELEPRYDGL